MTDDPVTPIEVGGRTVRCEYSTAMETWCVWIEDGKTIGTYAARWDAVDALYATARAMKAGTA